MENLFYNMKKITLFILLSSFLFSFSSTEVRKIDLLKSTLVWKGTKVIGGAHSGTINFQSGYINIENNGIVGGEFVVDMNTINCTDLKGKSKAKLERHLKDTHFFEVEKYPTSRFKIVKITKVDAKNYQVTGDLTIKNHTNSNTFLLHVSNHLATGKLIIKRNEFDIKYGSGFFGAIGNKTISNEFTLQIKLLF